MTSVQTRSPSRLRSRVVRPAATAMQQSRAPWLFITVLVWFVAGEVIYLHHGGRLALLALAVPLLLCLAALHAQSLRGAVILWIAVSPLLYPFVRYPHAHAVLNFDRLWLVPLGLALLIGRRRQPPARLGLLGRAGLTFTMLFGIRTAFSGPHVQSALLTWLDAIVLPLGVFLVVRQLSTTKTNRLKIAGAMAWGGTVVALLGMTQRIFGYELASLSGGAPRTDSGLPGVVRVSGPYSVPEVYSLVLVSTLAATLYWWQANRRSRVIGMVSIMVQAAGLTFSLFRVSWLAGLLVLVIAVGFRPHRHLRAIATVVGTALLAMLALVPLDSVSVFTERVGNTTNVVGRFATYVQAFDIFKTSPIFGVGVDHYNDVASQLAGVYLNGVRSVDFAHSSFLDVLAEQGLMGFLPLIGVIAGLALFARGVWVRAETSEQRILAATVLAALVGYLLFSSTLTMITYGDSNAYLAAILGLGAGVLTETRYGRLTMDSPDLPVTMTQHGLLDRG